MLVEHAGRRPLLDPSAWVAPTAVLSGAVTVGPGARILYGAVLTAEAGAELSVGAGCVVMENAVLRAAGRFPLVLGERVLVGPHAYLTGCTVEARSFIATGAKVFNGATVGAGSVVALGATVHVATELPGGGRVPIGWIAYGRPARIYRPEEANLVREELAGLSFMRYVFGVETEGRGWGEVMDEALTKYARGLGAHADDRVVE